jgi:hypothetical protein
MCPCNIEMRHCPLYSVFVLPAGELFVAEELFCSNIFTGTQQLLLDNFHFNIITIVQYVLSNLLWNLNNSKMLQYVNVLNMNSYFSHE